jgi:hypothetical protein
MPSAIDESCSAHTGRCRCGDTLERFGGTNAVIAEIKMEELRCSSDVVGDGLDGVTPA